MEKYTLTREIADVAIHNGGEVFGGYVRDFILHDDAAKKFYKTGSKDTYSDPTVSPETIDRLLVPRDIDVHFKTFPAWRCFFFALKNLGLGVKLSKNTSPYEKSFRHIKVQIYASITKYDIMKKLKGFSMVLLKKFECEEINLPFVIDVDVIISAKNPPFGSLDFGCNGLIMDKNGIKLCDDLAQGLNPEGKYRTLMNIIEDIKSKTARLYNVIPNRWDKMVDRPGWKVISGNLEVSTSSDDCIICHGGSDHKMYKFRCCSAMYHVECMCNMIMKGCIDNGTCIHCRQILRMTPEELNLLDVR